MSEATNVYPFPGRDTDEAGPDTVAPGAGLDRIIVAGEIVPDDAPVRTAPADTTTAGAVKVRRPAVPPVVWRKVKTGASHSRRGLGKGTRVTVRSAVTVAQGHASWARRAADAATHGHVREQIRLARQVGDRVALAEWTERLALLKDGRAQRLQQLPATLFSALKALFVTITVLAGVLLVAGIVFQFSPGGTNWFAWWDMVGDVLGVLGVLIGLAVQIVMWGTLPTLLFAAWREGRRSAMVPRWLVSETERAEMDSEITPDLINRALAHVKVKELAAFLKHGGALEYLIQPREQGGGTYTQIRLPLGVVAADLLATAKVELLAGNLGRHKHEVWPQRDPAADARVLDLWIADKGTMDRPAPAWPLLADGEFDVFRDRLPWGATMRQEQIAVGMLQKHWLIGATSKQGKSTVMRLLALGLALDPTVELLVADLKGDGDWKMFQPRATRYIEGSTPEDAEATCEMLEWGVAEMERRYQAKSDQNVVGPISRELSRRKGSGFHPIYLFVDECQVLYGAEHPIGGTKSDARAVKAAKKLHDQARAVNVHLMQATQRPDDRTLPVRVREGAHVRCALNVPNESTARMILADAVDRGARPQDLRPMVDAGTVVATGEVEDIPTGQAFVITRTHYVSTKEAYGVIARAMAILKRYGRTVDPTTEPTEQPVPVDHLANIEAALRDEPRVRTTVVLARLIEHDPDTYTGMSSQAFSAMLDTVGVQIRKYRGDSVLALAEVTTVLTQRNENVDDATGDDTDSDD
ncbi:S-DNA-T family DNA segregation ATPase FtsK/SpoIIIE [Umezawaea tangerina]|uniref:S-DNA-T family DNA segregation ATPase FtsK/SpoIIIE n=1 Tax=Umezawaea tangerina TaxID=84725 RepID=A0A2T0SS85_9PSEU|nr:S-DNA-T family DNA segregation ATPase FtsK/SpoIIIE [Umezawaea tangerina]